MALKPVLEHCLSKHLSARVGLAMSSAPTTDDSPSSQGRNWTRKKRWLIPLALLALIIAAAAILWASREEIADDFIVQELDKLGLEAEYDVGSIGPSEQVLRNLVVGDPQSPDLTIEEVRVKTDISLFGATLGQITLVKPRLYGTYRDGKLSFGALDPVIFTDSDEPFALPAYNLAIRDGRALMQSDYGDVGLKIEGEGPLDTGFNGTLAIAAPQLAVEGCSITGASLYGDIETQRGAPKFQGPIRLGALTCPQQQIALRQLAMDTRLLMPASFAVLDASASIAAENLRFADTSAQALAGDITAIWDSTDEEGEGLTNTKYDLSAKRVGAPQWSLANPRAEGGLRIRGAFARSELDVDLTGENLRTGIASVEALAEAEVQSAGTLAAPLLAKLQRSIARLERNNALSASVTARQTGAIVSATVAEARLITADRTSGLTITRLQYSGGGAGGARLTGNFAASGGELPQLSGRMEQRGGGSLVLRVTMPEYREGDARVSIPGMDIGQDASGAVSFVGDFLASGAIPGGDVRGLRLPVRGRWSSAGGLALWEECVQLGYQRLAVSGLNLADQDLRFCPNSGRAIVSSGGDGIRIGARMAGLSLAGDLGETPFRLASGPLDVNWPGAVTTSDLAVTLGAPSAPNMINLTDVSMDIGERVFGQFSGLEVKLDAVPMDILEGAGAWAYDDGVITIADSSFRVIDRNGDELDRFEPLIARDARITVAGNNVTANALLRHPASDREVANIAIEHNLASAEGQAAIAIANLTFDGNLQPQAIELRDCFAPDGSPQSDPMRMSRGLSCLPFGVISEVDGRVTGTGQINWNADDIVSSGSFALHGLDFLAPFGPVKETSGTIEFTDLVSLTTAPNQVMEIASVNPGIEVFDGVVTYAIRDGLIIDLQGGVWPFLGGRLAMEPVLLDFSTNSEKRYIFEVDGLDAAAFVAQMEFSDLSATGTFDGRLPIVFDRAGNGSIQGSFLEARAPGGNVAYVGALTYEDMGFVSNFAFNMLKSLDYTGMRIGIEGPLTGILATSVEIDGIQQGKGASRNILTRELAKLPVQLNINVTGRFYELIDLARSTYDPSFLDLAKIRAQQQQKQTPEEGEGPELDLSRPDEITEEKPTIQLEESEAMP